jgi:hypothetical protein
MLPTNLDPESTDEIEPEEGPVFRPQPVRRKMISFWVSENFQEAIQELNPEMKVNDIIRSCLRHVIKKNRKHLESVSNT